MAHTHKLVDGVRVALTADEITQLNANDTTWKNDSLNRALEKLRVVVALPADPDMVGTLVKVNVSPKFLFVNVKETSLLKLTAVSSTRLF